MLAQVRDRCPGVRVERLTVTHRADDDNVYFLGDEYDPNRVQVDTCPDGHPPFTIESNTQRTETSNVSEAATVISEWLAERS